MESNNEYNRLKQEKLEKEEQQNIKPKEILDEKIIQENNELMEKIIKKQEELNKAKIKTLFIVQIDNKSK